jgi:hypothetical protein
MAIYLGTCISIPLGFCNDDGIFLSLRDTAAFDYELRSVESNRIDHTEDHVSGYIMHFCFVFDQDC